MHLGELLCVLLGLLCELGRRRVTLPRRLSNALLGPRLCRRELAPQLCRLSALRFRPEASFLQELLRARLVLLKLPGGLLRARSLLS